MAFKPNEPIANGFVVFDKQKGHGEYRLIISPEKLPKQFIASKVEEKVWHGIQYVSQIPHGENWRGIHQDRAYMLCDIITCLKSSKGHEFNQNYQNLIECFERRLKSQENLIAQLPDVPILDFRMGGLMYDRISLCPKQSSSIVDDLDDYISFFEPRIESDHPIVVFDSNLLPRHGFAEVAARDIMDKINSYVQKSLRFYEDQRLFRHYYIESLQSFLSTQGGAFCKLLMHDLEKYKDDRHFPAPDRKRSFWSRLLSPS